MDRQYSDMAPGLTQAVHSGDELVMRDNDGNEFSVKAIIDPKTMEFLKAFDEWYVLKQSGPVSSGIIDALWSNVQKAYRDLPGYVVRDLPSIKNAGTRVQGHSHA